MQLIIRDLIYRSPLNNNSHYMNKIQGGDKHLTYRLYTFMV